MGNQNWKQKLMDMNTGLTKISISSDQKNEQLPTVQSVKPSNTPIENRLVKILDVKALGSEIIGYLVPNYAGDGSLSPNEYQGQLKNVLEQIGTLSAKEKRPPVLKLYQEVEELLKTELKDNDLLDEFRVMLLQG